MKQKVLKLMCLLCISMIGISVWGADVTYKFEITPSDFNSTSYAANNNEKTTTAVCTTDKSITMDVKWTSNQVMLQSSVMQWQSGKGYIYNSTDLGEIQTVTVTSSSGTFTTYYGKTSQPSSSTTNNGDGFFQVKVGSATGKTSKIEVTFVIKDKTETSTTINTTGITNTDINVSTAAGTLTANVVDDSDNAIDASSVVWTSSDESVATVGETTGVVTLVNEGTATITATYPSNDTYGSSTDTYVITVINSLYTEVWSEDFTGYNKYDVPSTGTNATYSVENGGGTTCAYDEYLAGGSKSELLVAKSNGSFTATITSLNNCLGTYKLSYKSNKTLSVEVLVNGASVKTSTDNNFTFNMPENPRTLVITFTNTQSSNARLDDIVLKGVADEVTYERGELTVGNYGTICLNSPASATGAEFYTIAGKDAEKTPSSITLVAADASNLQAGVGYIFKATADKIVAIYKDFAVATAADAANGLQGTLVAINDFNGVAGSIYMLSSNQIQAVNKANSTLKANRAYIVMDNVPVVSSDVKGIRFNFDGTIEDATGISDITPAISKGKGAIYNLNGQRMETMQRGINIVNGKKVIIK